MGVLSVVIKGEDMRELYPISTSTFMCVHEPTGKLYVKKVLPSECAEQYRRISALDNAHVARVSCETTGEELNVFRPYLSGDTLQDYLDERGAFPVEEAVEIVLQICDGLEALHSVGVIHRDVTPRNVLISEDGVVRLIDFGISRTYKAGCKSDTVIMGTPGYAAPEQFGFAQSDPRTDIYALGVLLNFIVTGGMPSEGIAEGKTGDIVKKCISIDASARFADVKSLRKALRPLQGRRTYSPNSVFSEGDGLLDHIFLGMPGLRSDKRHVRVWSAVGYVLAVLLLMISVSDARVSVGAYVMTFVSWVLMIVMPLFCFGNMFGFRDFFMPIRNSSERSKRLFFNIAGWISLLLGITIFGKIP